jgi:steroid 5-alpha reductase family enzyme
MPFNELSSVLLKGWTGTAALMAGLWLFARAKRNAGVVDVGWALSLGALAAYYAAVGPGSPERRLLTAALPAVWSLRLVAYLGPRVLSEEKGEDARYRDLRAKWGDRADRNFFFFFQAQALLNVFLSLPFLVCAFDARPGWDGQAAAACLLLAIAVVGEALADRQLSAWRAAPENAGKTCRAGLWRYSRHPNYFFEWLHWWCYPLLALGAPYGWVALIGPALMLFFLLKITGIPATEARALKSRSDYAEYQKTTSAFIPWFPGA